MNKIQNPKAVICNCNNIMSLPIIRSLGIKGIDITACFGLSNKLTPYHSIVKGSKYIKEKIYFEEDNYSANLITSLISYSKTQKEKPVLFLASDQDLISCSENRISIQDYFHFTLPPHELIDKLLNKEKFIDLAISNDLTIPKSKKIISGKEIILASKEFRFPFIIKPSWRNNEWLNKFKEQKLFYINNATDLWATSDLIKNIKTNFFMQEIITGGETNILCSFAILDNNSDPIELGFCRKLRQYPKDFGNTSLAEPIYDKELEKLSIEIFKKLKLAGYASIEFKRDPINNNLKIIEITPNRFNRQFAVTNIIGLNLPYALYNFELGNNHKSKRKVYSNLKWVSEVNEFRTIKSYIRSKEYSQFGRLKGLKKIGWFEIFDKKDFRPFFILVIDKFKKTMGFKYIIKNKKNCCASRSESV